MNTYLAIKSLHIISSTILFGTGIGLAFFMVRSCFTDNLHERFFAIRTTVLADTVFTLPAILLQPLTGFWLIHTGGLDWKSSWLLITYGVYGLVVLCWLPVVWIQIQLRKIVAIAIEHQSGLPPLYYKFFRIWFVLGWPALAGLVFIFYLMVVKPV